MRSNQAGIDGILNDVIGHSLEFGVVPELICRNFRFAKTACAVTQAGWIPPAVDYGFAFSILGAMYLSLWLPDGTDYEGSPYGTPAASGRNFGVGEVNRLAVTMANGESVRKYCKEFETKLTRPSLLLQTTLAGGSKCLR